MLISTLEVMLDFHSDLQVLQTVKRFRSEGYTGNIYEKVSSECLVPVGNVSRWVKQEEFISTQAGQQEAARVMGLHLRRFGGYTRKRREVPNILADIEQNILHELRQPDRQRRALSTCHVKRVARAALAKYQVLGYEIRCSNGKKFKASAHWCWRFLIKNGYVSRRRGKKRTLKMFILNVDA